MSAHLYIFGRHAVQSLLNNQPERVVQLFVQKNAREQRLQTLVQQAAQLGIAIATVNKEELDRLTQQANHQGIVVYCHKQALHAEADLKTIIDTVTTPLLLILDGVQDPHNLGACFRTADAAGVHAIIVPKDKAVGITSVVSKVASGAAEVLPFIQVTNLARTLAMLKEAGIWLYGADEKASQSLYQTKLQGPIGIVLGAEGTGLRRLTREHCDVLLSVPMQGSVASLNVSVACGVILFEAVRQRLWA